MGTRRAGSLYQTLRARPVSCLDNQTQFCPIGEQPRLADVSLTTVLCLLQVHPQSKRPRYIATREGRPGSVHSLTTRAYEMGCPMGVK